MLSPLWQLNLHDDVFSLAHRILGILFLLCFQLEGAINISKLRNLTHPGTSKLCQLCSQHWPIIVVWGYTALGVDSTFLLLPLPHSGACYLITVLTMAPKALQTQSSGSTASFLIWVQKPKLNIKQTSSPPRWLSWAALYIWLCSRGIKNLTVLFSPTNNNNNNS